MSLAHVERVGTAVGPAGLREMDVGVDEPGHEPGTGEIDDADVGGHRAALARTGAVDLAVAQEHDRVGDGRSAAAVDERRADQGARRRRRARRRREGGRGGDPPAPLRGHEPALGEARLLLVAALAVAVDDTVAIGAVDDSGLDRHQSQVLGVEDRRPILACGLLDLGVAESDAAGAGANQALRLQIAGEVGVAIAPADGVEIALEEGARRLDVRRARGARGAGVLGQG